MVRNPRDKRERLSACLTQLGLLASIMFCDSRQLYWGSASVSASPVSSWWTQAPSSPMRLSRPGTSTISRRMPVGASHLQDPAS